MKLSKLMIAVATLAAGSAFALPASVAYVTGASATKNNQKLALTSLCTAAGGVFSNPTYMNSGSNISTYVCSQAAINSAAEYVTAKNGNKFVKFDGTDYTEVRLSVANGSFTALQGLAGQLDSTDDQFVDPLTGSIEHKATSIGGLTDVEAEAFLVSNPAPNATVIDAGIAQTFGVVVSPLLYTAMFNKQKADGALPSTCVVADTGKPECVPSIGKADMASILNANEFAAVKLTGADYFGSTSGAELKYYRRVDTSGTQAAAQVYFLDNPCSSGAVGVIPQPTTDNEAGGLKDKLYNGKFRVYAAPTTGDVRTGVNSTTAYAIGIISGENNQTGVNWKWIRVQGANLAENATPGTSGNTNINTAAAGRYDYFFESKAYFDGDNASASGFFSALTSALQGLSQPAGLKTVADLGYTRNGNSCSVPAK